MTLQHNTGHLYDLREIARHLRVGVDEVIQLVQAKGFKTATANGDWYISAENLTPFLREFQLSRGIPERYHHVPEWLQQCAAPWAVALNDMYRLPFVFPIGLSPAQGDLLRTLVCNIAPRIVVEIGCFIGISTLWMAAGLEQNRGNGIVHSIDMFDDMLPDAPHHYGYIPDRLQLAWKFAHAAQLSPRIKFHKGDSRKIARRPHFLDGPIDFLFIDGDHAEDGCLTDFIQFLPHVAIGGYIAFHDINPHICHWTGPRYVLDTYVKTSSALDLVEIQTAPENFGIALIHKRGDALELSPEQFTTMHAPSVPLENLRP